MANDIHGLSDAEVLESRAKNGTNFIIVKKNWWFFKELWIVIKEPMFLMILGTIFIYIIITRFADALIMLVALIVIGLISIYQSAKSKNATDLLKKMAAPRAMVIRYGNKMILPAEELVVGDLILVNEGEHISADGIILKCSDFSVNEAIITGESLPVIKKAGGHDVVYRGTNVITGNALVKITQVGSHTTIGKIGKSIAEIVIPKTPLQLQIKKFMIAFVVFGLLAFVIIVVAGIFQGDNFWTSLMRALTLSMSILPEEIPVTFSTFLTIAAFQLSQINKIIVKHPVYVETLGCTSVIAVDKTGTLTKNEMELTKLYELSSGKVSDLVENDKLPEMLMEYAMWGSETDAYDPMEKSIHVHYEKQFGNQKRKEFRLVHEYPLMGMPAVMTHIFQNEKKESIIALKGSPEKIMQMTSLSEKQLEDLHRIIEKFVNEGLRVLGVGKASWPKEPWPEKQESFKVEMLGLLAFRDPPKEHIAECIQTFQKAGIQVKMITGDHEGTALAIASMAGIAKGEKVYTGKEIMLLDHRELGVIAIRNNVFARMFPEAKLKLIEALKEAGEVVAMTGDGVNDGPALKAAHIGIAMGKRGSEVAREASSLILSDDDLAHMTAGIKTGRTIYNNLRKAVRYIIAIHIPIIMIVAMPLLLHWRHPDIFSPVHIVFFELLMGPACALVFQNIKDEPGILEKKPRNIAAALFSTTEIIQSVLKGLLIAFICLIAGFLAEKNYATSYNIRTVIFSTLFFSNLLLVFNESSLLKSQSRFLDMCNRQFLIMAFLSMMSFIMIMFLRPLTNLFKLCRLEFHEYIFCLIMACSAFLPTQILFRLRRPNK